MFNRKDKRDAIMEAIKRTTDLGSCVILSSTPAGTRVIMLGNVMTRQLHEIARDKEVRLC